MQRPTIQAEVDDGPMDTIEERVLRIEKALKLLADWIEVTNERIKAIEGKLWTQQ